MKAVFRKRDGALIPADDRARELLAKFKDRRDVIVEVRQARNVRHLRLYWAMIDFVRMHAVDKRGHSLFPDADDKKIHTAIKLATGLVDTFLDMSTGKTVLVPMSVAFESMDQIRFGKFFEAACTAICQRWMPAGTTSEEVRRELLAMVDGPHAIGERAA